MPNFSGLRCLLAAAFALVSTIPTIAQDPFATSDNPSSVARIASERIYGAILPADKVDLGHRKEGVIDQVMVQLGDSVSKGQTVIHIDDSELTSRVALAEAELRKAKAIGQDQSAVMAARSQFSRAEATWKSHQNLQQKSELELFRLQMEMRERQAAYEQALSKHEQDVIDVAIKNELLSLARLDLRACQIASPIAGIVAEQLRYPGESIRPGESVLKIIRMDELVFRVELNMRHVSPNRLSEYGATIALDVAPDETIEIPNVRFDRILPSNVDDQHYYALARIKNTQVVDGQGILHWTLRPGMSGEVHLHLSSDEKSFRPSGHFTTAR